MRARNERIGSYLELRPDLAVRALGEQGCGHEKWDEKWSDEQPAKTTMEGMHLNSLAQAGISGGKGLPIRGNPLSHSVLQIVKARLIVLRKFDQPDALYVESCTPR